MPTPHVRKSPRLLLHSLTLILAAPVVIQAQATAAAAIAFGGVDKVLSRIETVDLYFGWSMLQPKQGPGSRYRVPSKTEYGLEFSMHVGSYGDTAQSWFRSRAKKQADEFVKAGAIKDTTEAQRAKVAAAMDPKWKVNGLTVKRHAIIAGKDSGTIALDSEFVAVRPDTKEPDKVWDLDFALGYGQLDGLKRYDPYEFRGYVRELPSVSLYATRETRSGIGVYVGARTGVITLQDGQLYVPAIPASGSSPAIPRKTYALSATTYQMGGAFGLVFPVTDDEDAPAITFEFSYLRRNFNSIESNGADTIPTDAPHSLDLTGGNLSIGVMFPLPKPSR